MLRDYQIDICGRVEEAFARHRSVMVQMPTGTGKTMVLATLVMKVLEEERKEGRPGRILIVAHRRELIEQVRATIKRMKMAPPHSGEGIVVESIQTISRRMGNSPNGQWGGFSLVVIDEAHHALAKTYRMMWEAWPGARFLGLTATPYRLSGDGFTDLFDVLVQSWPVKRFIAEGWLCPYDYYAVRTGSDDLRRIDSMTKRGTDGDYQTREMREKLDAVPCIERLYASYKKHADGKKGIVYAIDIAHAEHIAAYYRQQRVEAVAISSKTAVNERKAIVQRFKGAGGILVSVDLFSEGFDCPDVEFIQIARPTLSLAKYLQMVGRGLRSHEGKEYCAIIDNVGLYRRFGLPSAVRDWDAAFCGFKDEITKESNSWHCDAGIISPSLMEDMGEEVVKIVSHESMAGQYKGVDDTGFERRRNIDGYATWVDKVNGVEFESMPRVVDYAGMELSTDNGIMFYPRIVSSLIDGKSGIHYNLLMMQVGDGILWKRRYVSLSNPTRVYRLVETMGNGLRVFNDEYGRVYLQQNPDMKLVAETEVSRAEMMRRCDEDALRISGINSRRMEYLSVEWTRKYPVSISEETLPGERLQRVKYGDMKMRDMATGWVDMKTRYVYTHKPETLQRGCLDLLRDDGLVYIRNIKGMYSMGHPNFTIRSDGRLCVVGDMLFVKNNGCFHSYKIRKKSEDLTFFVVDEHNNKYVIENNPGGELETRRLKE